MRLVFKAAHPGFWSINFGLKQEKQAEKIQENQKCHLSKMFNPLRNIMQPLLAQDSVRFDLVLFVTVWVHSTLFPVYADKAEELSP